MLAIYLVSRRRALQQLCQRLRIEPGHAGRAVAARLLAGRDQVEAAVPDLLQRGFHQAGLRRIALVVGGIDGQQRRRDALQARRGVVVARGFPLVEDVVGIGGERRRQPLVEKLVGLLARRRHLLVGQRAARGGDAVEHGGRPEGLGLGRVVAVLPVGIVADRIDDQPPHHPVAARHRRRLGRHGRQGVHEIRIFRCPTARCACRPSNCRSPGAGG